MKKKGKRSVDLPFFDEFGGKFIKKTRCAEDEIGAEAAAVVAGVGKVQLVFGAGDGNVKKAAFFFKGGRAVFFKGSLVGEHAFAEADQENDFPFKAFGLVDGGEGDALF